MATHEMATHALGNTKARAWQITLNQVVHYDEIKNYICGLKSLRYFLSAKELAPSTKHEHIHIYCNFSNAIKLSNKKCCNAHIEMCRGTPQQNINYIKKDGDILDEIGDPPIQGGCRVKDLKETENPEDLDWHMYKTWKQIKSDNDNLLTVKDVRKFDIKVYWIQGPSGCGKTEKAYEIIGDRTFCDVKFTGDYWIGVHEKAECCLYDDFRDSSMKPQEFINFIDYNVHNLNIKGGSCKNRFKTIIITSIQSLDDIYRNSKEPREQWMRRIEVVDLNPVLKE